MEKKKQLACDASRLCLSGTRADNVGSKAGDMVDVVSGDVQPESLTHSDSHLGENGGLHSRRLPADVDWLAAVTAGQLLP